VKENFRIKALFGGKARHSIDDEFDIPLTQFTRERRCLDMKRYARMLPQQPIDDDLNHSRRLPVRAPNPEFSYGRVGEKGDLVYALFQFVEDSNAAFDERGTVLSWLNTLRAAIQETDAESPLHVGDRFRNGGL
jgi:hypothetical protein